MQDPRVPRRRQTCSETAYRGSGGMRPQSYGRQEPSKPRKKKRSCGCLIFVLLLIAAVAVGVWYFLFYKPTPPKDPTPPGADTAPQPEMSGPARQEGVYNFLFVGKDHVALNTDVMMIVSYDVEHDSLSALQIPRDTFLLYRENYRRVNALLALFYTDAYENGSEDPYRDAMLSLRALLEDSLAVKIDYYALVDLNGFGAIIDAIGGVPMNVPYRMDYDDPDQDLHIHLKEGEQILDGEQAQMFVRFRSGYVQGDIGRVQAQKIFLSALLKQIKNGLTITTVPRVVSAGCSNLITTNLSLAESGFFVKELLSVDLSKTALMTLPGWDARANVDSGAWFYILARADTFSLVNMYFNVYEEPVPESKFDPHRLFTTDAAHINGIYSAEAGTYPAEIYYADSVNQSPPSIPLLNG